MDGRMVTAFSFAFGAAVAGSLGADGLAQSKDGAGQDSAGAGPEVWLCTGKAFDLARPEAQWDFVKQRLTGIQLYIDKVNKAKREDLDGLVQVVAAIAFGAGGWEDATGPALTRPGTWRDDA